MERGFRYQGSERRAGTRARVATQDGELGSVRDYWMGIVIGYLAAVLTSVGLMLAFMRQGW